LVVVFDQFGRHGPELGVEVVEVPAESVPLELMFNSPGYKAAKAASSDVLFDSFREALVDAH